MDIHLGDPNSAVTVVECCHWGHNAMALQLRHRAVLAKHVGYFGQGGLQHVSDFWVIVVLDVFVRLFLRS